VNRVALAGLALLALAEGTALAADARFPDWPCRQIKVPTLSVAAVWTGPSIESVGTAWKDNPQLQDLVLTLAARRTSLGEAAKAATRFVSGSPSERKEKGTLLFAGLFDTLSKERGEIMDGIERFARRQKALRDQLRNDLAELRSLEDAKQQDDPAIEKTGDRVAWDTRIFDERRQAINYVCDVPAVIEHRLFALAQVIQKAME
jgi:hypothetical protein